MQTDIFPLLIHAAAQAHAEGFGYDELLPAGLAVLIGLGVYTILSNGGSGKRGAKRAPRRDE
ncbi:MAG: hypothetical protein NTZ05_23315 [Chloroflexi bacterium]|nr:hypothetical protein [Chloroflexota bacterium]